MLSLTENETLNLIGNNGDQRPPDEILEQLDLLETIDKVIRTLDPASQFVIEKRFLAEPRLTMEEVGNEMGLSRERIRQMEAKALRTLRHPERIRAINGNEPPPRIFYPARPKQLPTTPKPIDLTRLETGPIPTQDWRFYFTKEQFMDHDAIAAFAPLVHAAMLSFFKKLPDRTASPRQVVWHLQKIRKFQKNPRLHRQVTQILQDTTIFDQDYGCDGYIYYLRTTPGKPRQQIQGNS